MSVTVSGKFDTGLILRSFLEREYAFSFFCARRGVTVKVAFNKGYWTANKYAAGLLTDTVTLSDAPNVEDGSPLAKGLLEAKVEIEDRKIGKFGIPCRSLPAAALVSFFDIWAGRLEDITEIHVIQDGRNAVIEDGEFILSRAI